MMGIFDKRKKTVEIQATEGLTRKVEIDSLLYGRLETINVPGTINDYETYDQQIAGIYDKYNGLCDFGNQQTRAIVDIRTSFIAGEGISVSCEDDATADWIENFLQYNKLDGSSFLNAVKATEMGGQTLFVLELRDENEVKVLRYKYSVKSPFKPIYNDKNYTDEIIDIQVKNGELWQSLNIANYIYIRTGGDDSNLNNPTTRIGIVLTDIDNYDRALKDIRRNNYVFARVTPTFEVGSESEAKSLKRWLQTIQWKIGTAFIGKAKFRYESPPTSAYENLNSEMIATIKTISATTGVPVHWIGFVDLMSNRATANSLFESIKNATISERQVWEEGLYDLIIKAQEMYINSGGSDIKFNKDFEVKLPLINFEGFMDRVKALSLAYADEAISMDDYRNEIPGINPLKTKKAVEAEKEARAEELVRMGVPNIINPEEEGDEDGD